MRRIVKEKSFPLSDQRLTATPIAEILCRPFRIFFLSVFGYPAIMMEIVGNL